MDKHHIFSRDDLPYFQDWIRKVSGRQVWIKPIDEKWAIKESGGISVPAWFKWGIAWGGYRIIYLNVANLERTPTSSTYLKAVLLHEAGHLIHPRKGCYYGGRGHGYAGKEYLAHFYAIRKTNKLGLEAERVTLIGMARRMYDNGMGGVMGAYGRHYRIAYRMLWNVGVV